MISPFSQALPGSCGRWIVWSWLVLAAVSCGGVAPTDYAQEKPTLNFRDYLQGDLTGWGIFQDRSGKVTKRFRINMVASWQGDDGKLSEHFLFNDGSRLTREWLLTRVDEQHYLGKAGDSVGVGKGEVHGNTMHWKYTIRTQSGDSEYDLDYDYWMYLVDERTMINRATLSKFGVFLGDITVTFQKAPGENTGRPKTPTSKSTR